MIYIYIYIHNMFRPQEPSSDITIKINKILVNFNLGLNEFSMFIFVVIPDDGPVGRNMLYI
jgi:hypothetical protein